MGKIIKENINEKRTSIGEKRDQLFKRELLKKIEEVQLLIEDSKEEEAKVALDSMINTYLKILGIDKEDRKITMDKPMDRRNIPSAGDVLAENDMVLLKIISNEEYESYMEVKYECSTEKVAFEDEDYKNQLWNNWLSEYRIVVSIYDKVTGNYVGYCSVHDIRKSNWELGIELKKEYRNKGYGFNAVSLFIEKITELTGNRYYKALVDIDNKASQKLLKKIGAYPDGISEYMLFGDDLSNFQKENAQFITDDVRAIAEEFCMDAEDILGYVLQYRIDAKDNRN